MSTVENRAPLRRETLKQDTFGAIVLCRSLCGEQRIIRDLRPAPWWARPLARWLMRREARALGRLPAAFAAPRLLALNTHQLQRSFVAGVPMYEARPTSRAYFRAARKLLNTLHRAGITHNDLAKEPNWLVTGSGDPAVVDFQLASVFTRRGWRFRQQAREDLRHLLKHKRTYLPDALTARERRILAQPSIASRLWRQTGKRVYLWVTRGLLNWSDREGAADRGRDQ